jgi:ABC-type transport system involved in multi-copper enzyme maturation permease subunit
MFSVVSFVSPEKIFWDFSLGMSFVVQVILGSYLSTHLLNEEKERRTLHIVLAKGVSRGLWLVGNGLGIWVFLVLMNGTWLLLSAIVSKLFFGIFLTTTIIQCQSLLAMELFILLPLSLFFSLFLRSALAWFLTLSLTMLLHSQSLLENILQENTLKNFSPKSFYHLIFKALNWLPQLEWFDLRMMVGYGTSLSAANMLLLILFGMLWGTFFYISSSIIFKKMDL